MPKRYMVTNTFRTEFPIEFQISKESRHISVLNVKLLDIATGNLLMNVSCHGDFISDNADRNSFMCFCNEMLPKRKKWEIFHKPRYVNFHFEDMTGVLIDPLSIQFTVELLLDY